MNDLEKKQDSIKVYVNSTEKQKQLYKKTINIVMFAQIFGGAGLAAGVTVGALLAQQMLGTDNLAGVPMALFTLGSAGAAMLVGRFSQKFGRRIGLSIGFLTGGLGAAGIVLAAVLNNIPLMFISLLIYGSGTATNLQARYAGTDLASPKQRATAVSMGMVSTTFGAVAGPNLTNVMGNFAEYIGVPSLAGPFILAALAYTLAGLAIFFLLTPDPLFVANAIAYNENENTDYAKVNVANNSLSTKGEISIGATIMILTQIVMVSIMTMTPIYMKSHGYDLKEVGLVIGFHIGSMYLPSLITGVIADKIGKKLIVALSGITLVLSALIAALAPPSSLVLLIVALSLLGLGWNLGLISGTAIIVDSTVPSNRAKIQGSIDVLISLSGAASGFIAGIVVSHSSYMALSLGGGVLALILLPIIMWSNFNKKTES